MMWHAACDALTDIVPLTTSKQQPHASGKKNSRLKARGHLFKHLLYLLF